MVLIRSLPYVPALALRACASGPDHASTWVKSDDHMLSCTTLQVEDWPKAAGEQNSLLVMPASNTAPNALLT